ncbi:MAG: hypothetical protein IPJ69_02990 [Deltaproteobacteria bacterium]|nr:MAG: hypothetical protein IPJ69_02990 [Deltaproteobacteria bacterium]
MAITFQEGLGIQKKAPAKPQGVSYQNLNIQDFIGLGGAHEPTEQERLSLQLEQEKQKLEQDQAQWKSCIQSFNQALQQLKQDFEQAKAQLASNLLELTFFLTHELIDHEITTQPSILAHATEKLSEQTIAIEQRTLSLNPSDHLFLKKKARLFSNSSVLSKSWLSKIPLSNREISKSPLLLDK